MTYDTYDTNGNKTHEEKWTSSVGTVGGIDYQYDGLNHLIQKTEYIDANHSRVTTMSYDVDGNLSTIQDGTGAIISYPHDEMNHIVAKIINDPNNAANNSTTTYQYDTGGNMISMIDPLGNPTSFSYDGIDRIIAKTIP